MCLKFHFAKNVQQSVLYCFDKVEGSLKNRLSGFHSFHCFERPIFIVFDGTFHFLDNSKLRCVGFYRRDRKGKICSLGYGKKTRKYSTKNHTV